jgi:hypothetical protein
MPGLILGTSVPVVQMTTVAKIFAGIGDEGSTTTYTGIGW